MQNFTRLLQLGKKNNKGFTLLELLLVVAGIAILATIVFAVLSPADTLNKFNDSKRKSDIQEVMTAMKLYSIDNGGDVPNKTSDGWGTKNQTICADNGNEGDDCDLALTDLTDASHYLVSIPTDPTVGTSAVSGYTAEIDLNGVVTLSATLADNSTFSVVDKFNPI